MRWYADTSFITSLYLNDDHSPAAHLAIQARGAILPLTLFGEFELTNAIRATVVRRASPVSDAEAALSLVRQDALSGRLAQTACDWEMVFGVASSLSQRHTYAGGYRALDVIHVAVATVIGCTDFLTFDQRQTRLAQQAGLETLP